MSDIPFTLSSDFQSLAVATDAASYKMVIADVFYHMPDHPHLVREFTVQMYDKLDLNIEDLIIIQAAMENPDLASHLLKYLSHQRAVDLSQEQIHHLHKKNNAKYAGSDDADAASETMVQDIKDKVAKALVRRFEFASELGSYKRPHTFQANFSGMTTAASMANIDMHPDTRVLKKLRAFLKHWARDLDGPLHTATVAVSDLTSAEEIKEAARSVAAGVEGIKIVSRHIIGADDLKAKGVTLGLSRKLH